MESPGFATPSVKELGKLSAGLASVPVDGVDIGGTGIKGAPVDVAKGKLAAERVRSLTPSPATPGAVVLLGWIRA